MRRRAAGPLAWRLIGAAALAVLLVVPVQAEDDEATERRQGALEALRDMSEAHTDDEYDRALERFNQEVGGEQRAVRDQMMERIEPDEQ